jgi:hypothetical protein
VGPPGDARPHVAVSPRHAAAAASDGEEEAPMTCALDATVGGPEANTYVTQAEADAYWSSRLRPDQWVNRAADTKCRALQQATQLLDDYVDWAGVPASSTQRLAWPRWGVWALNGQPIQPTELPWALKAATAELARNLMLDDPQAPLDAMAQGVKRVKASSVEVEFTGAGLLAATPTAQKVIPPNVWSLIARWANGLTPAAGGSGGVEIPLVRV